MMLAWGMAALIVAVPEAAELQCIGRLAHEVKHSGPAWDGPGESWLSVEPAPSRDAECLGAEHLGAELDRRICVGTNEDASCQAAKEAVIPLPHGARCVGCFVGAATDVYYTLNVSRLRLQHIGLGFRGTQLHSSLQVEDDQGKAGKPRRGSKAFGEKPLELKLRLGTMELDLKVAMPTLVYYKIEGREGAHGDIGAKLVVDLGDNYIEYTHGQGWSHHKDKAKFSLAPIHEGDYDAMANLTVGIQSSLQAELGSMMWFHVNGAAEVPVGFSSTGSAGARSAESCLDMGLRLDLAHEAEVNLKIFNQTLGKHWGPTTDRQHDGTVLHKCAGMHPPKDVLVV